MSFGATGSVSYSTITGNNYTGPNFASSTGILAYGGGGSACGVGSDSPLVQQARFVGNQLTGNDIGIGLYNYDPTCTKAAATPTRDTACFNLIENSHGYPGGVASADANTTGFYQPPIGYQAGVADVDNHDVICDNAISGAGYAPLGATRSLPNPPPPTFVRPIDIVSAPTTDPLVFGNTFDGFYYRPH